MTVSLQAVGAITLFVDDPERSKSFYERVFDLPVAYEDEESAVFSFENLLVNLLRRQAAHELIAPAPVGNSEAGSQLQLTIWVDDADAACAELARRGVELLNGPLDRDWGKRTAAFTDPDGHVWELSQELREPDAAQA
jgi:catechol 2,3-dioxygenase-like lactoylglutathione lyase family enzyme